MREGKRGCARARLASDTCTGHTLEAEIASEIVDICLSAPARAVTINNMKILI